MTSDHELAGRIAVVTGAGSGFGAALARRFAEAGMAVAALDIDEPAARTTATTLASQLGVPTTAVRTDVGEPGSVTAAAEHVAATLGGCDLLCANVGVQQFGAVDRLTERDWAWLLNVNVMGTVRTVREFLPLLRSRTGWRHVTVTASSSVLAPGVRLGAYQATKFAVTGFAETLRAELAGEGIGVSVLFPGGMMTRHLESSALARPAELGESVTQPDDIEAMLAGSAMGPGDVVTADEAARNVLRDLLADEPYVLTHGSYRPEYQRRRDAMEAAFDRMEKDREGDREGP